FGTKGATRQLIGLRDANHLAHTLQQLDISRIEIGTHADGAEHRLRHSCRSMDIEPQRDEVVDGILNLLLARSGLHHDHHELSSDFFTFSLGIASEGSAFYTESKKLPRAKKRPSG